MYARLDDRTYRPLLRLRIRLFQRTCVRQRRARRQFRNAGYGCRQAAACYPARNLIVGPRVHEIEVFVGGAAGGRGEGKCDGGALVGLLRGADVAIVVADIGWDAGGAGDGVEEVVEGAGGYAAQTVFLRARVYDDRMRGVRGANVGGCGGIGRLSFLEFPLWRPD